AAELRRVLDLEIEELDPAEAALHVGHLHGAAEVRGEARQDHPPYHRAGPQGSEEGRSGGQHAEHGEQGQGDPERPTHGGRDRVGRPWEPAALAYQARDRCGLSKSDARHSIAYSAPGSPALLRLTGQERSGTGSSGKHSTDPPGWL